jgi:hypothetical protein
MWEVEVGRSGWDWWVYICMEAERFHKCVNDREEVTRDNGLRMQSGIAPFP